MSKNNSQDNRSKRTHVRAVTVTVTKSGVPFDPLALGKEIVAILAERNVEEPVYSASIESTSTGTVVVALRSMCGGMRFESPTHLPERFTDKASILKVSANLPSESAAFVRDFLSMLTVEGRIEFLLGALREVGTENPALALRAALALADDCYQAAKGQMLDATHEQAGP